MSDLDDVRPDRGRPADRQTGSLPSGYPPRVHLLRDLPFEMEETGPASATSRLRVTPAHCDRGRLDPGPVLVLTDVLGGFLVGRLIAPDWMATAQLALHLVDPPSGGEVRIDATVVRSGRSTVVVSVDLTASDGAADAGSTGAGSDGCRRAGAAELTFVRLPRRDSNPELPPDGPPDGPSGGRRISLAVPGSGLRRAFRHAVGLSGVDGVRPGSEVRLGVTPYVRNSFGAVNGGVVASLAVAAAEGAASEAAGAPVRAADVVVTYLAQARVGPVRATASVLRADGPVTLVRVEVVDEGAPGHEGAPRSTVTAHVHCITDPEPAR